MTRSRPALAALAVLLALRANTPPAPHPRGFDDALQAYCDGFQNVPECEQAIEAAALRGNRGATREGDRLTIRLGSGRTRTLVSNLQGAAGENYRYISFLPALNAHLVSVSWTECGESVLIGADDGHEMRIPGWPVVSENGAWLATSAGCFESNTPFTVEIWSIKAGHVKRTFALDATDWIPVRLTWTGASRLLVRTQNLEPRAATQFEVVYAGGRWHAPAEWMPAPAP